MNLKIYKAEENCNYLSIKEACSRANVGASTMRRIAEEAHAVIKIGRLYRINWQKIEAYLENLSK